MWTCPICGRDFQRQEQSHYCRKPASIEDYIAMQPEAQQPRLLRLREIIAEAIPQARETISWSMPTFRGKRNVIQFAAFRGHIGLYPGPEAVEAFADQLEAFETSKGTIRLPHSKPLPEELIARMSRWCWEKSNA